MVCRLYFNEVIFKNYQNFLSDIVEFNLESTP
jgi:hypothetical protein